MELEIVVLARLLADKLDDHWTYLRGDLFSSMLSGHQIQVAALPLSKSSINIEEALSEYLRHRGRGKGDRFTRYAERSVGYLIEFASSKRLTDYSRADANKLPDALIDRGLVASSIKRNFEGYVLYLTLPRRKLASRLLIPFRR